MEKNDGKYDIAVVIVLFNPSESDIQNVRELSVFYYGVVVDNSETPCIVEPTVGRLRYICNKRNLGIAEAQNIGISTILDQNAYTHIVFLDQDSRLPKSYPNDIVTEFSKLKPLYPKLAILGPTVSNKETGEEYKSVIHKYSTDDNGFSQRRHIISSGSCIPTTVLKDVGFMNSSMFIDYVDYEWCWRAEAKGYICGITDKIQICHKVGKRELSIGKYKVIISSPFRYFYQYRNYLWLIREKYVPLQWKLATGVKFLSRLVYFPLCVKGGTKCWKYMIKGIIQGIKK